MNTFYVLCFASIISYQTFGQKTVSKDSIAVRDKAKHLISLFEKVNLTEPNIVKFGRYYHAADDITYDGYHPADYTKAPERMYVDSICTKLSNVLTNNDQWVFGTYHTISPTIHCEVIKYRKSMRHQFSTLKLIFIKTETDFLLIGIE